MKSGKPKSRKPAAKKKTSASSLLDELADIFEIVDERRKRKSAKGRSYKQYLCTWMDAAPAQWLDEKDVAGTQALHDWKDKEEVVPERPDPDDQVKEKCSLLASWLKASRRPVFYTGAGISASVLPTFRGKNGLWTKDAHKFVAPNVPVAPTFTHRAITSLEKAGFVYFHVTQNYDDLSGKSGFPRIKQSELHGNIFMETCDKCAHEYYRDFEVPLESSTDHETGRYCEQPDCSGILRDNIVHFTEALPWHALKMANAKSVGADLSIVLGTSLRVEPAASMPFKSSRRKIQSLAAGTQPRAVIINLQPTPLDDEADLIIRATCDRVLEQVTRELAVDVPAV